MGVSGFLMLCSAMVPYMKTTAYFNELKQVFNANPLAITDGFDYPVGAPDGKGYYNAQKFQENYHLGEDWNGTGGGNTDLGDPVYAAANGYVVFSAPHTAGWGNVVRIVHCTFPGNEKRKPVYLETLYAHLDTILVASGDIVSRGQQIGTIGSSNGKYYAHLHFELRYNIMMLIGAGYGSRRGYLDPSRFINSHRKKIIRRAPDTGKK